VSTRGFVGFVIDGVEKIAYNHSDSYPDGLGLGVLGWLRPALAGDAEATAEAVRGLRAVDSQSKPTAEDVERLGKFKWTAAQHGGDRDLREGQEWYDLLREAQGEPKLMLEAGVIEDGSGFPNDSLFAEWGYMADFDAGRFEVYRGFQQSRGEGRFAERAESANVHGYWPVTLAEGWSFDVLPTDEAFTAAFTEADSEFVG
jgi:hypothetical protein